MRKTTTRYLAFTLALAFTFGLFPCLAAPAAAQDAKALIKEADKSIRQAERDMFSGKTDKAIASLDNIREMIDKAKAADPNYSPIKSAERKYTKLVKDLERRTGRDLGGGTTTTQAPSGGPAAPPKPQAKPAGEGAPPAKPAAAGPEAPSQAKLPYAARQPLSQVDGALSSVDNSIRKLLDPNFPADAKESTVKNIDSKLEYARKMLEEAKKLAAEKGVASHPDFDELEAKLADATKRADEAKSGYKAAQAAASATAQEVNADVKALEKEYERVRPVFDKASGVAIYYNDLEPVEKLIKEIEAFEKDDLSGLKSKAAAFAAKYGSTKEEIDKKADSMGFTRGTYSASFPYTAITEGIENVAKTRTVMADDLVRKAKDMIDNAKGHIHDFGRIGNQERIKAYGALAERFDAESPRVKEFLSGLDAWVKKDTDALNAKIDKATWPGQAASAPADAEALTKTARDFLQKEADKAAAKGKEGRKVLAVAITGSWRVFKKNLLGEPIQYGLPIVSAEQAESEKGLDLARVYQGTLLTEEFKGVKQAPPFIGAAVGDSYYIRPAAVK